MIHALWRGLTILAGCVAAVSGAVMAFYAIDRAPPFSYFGVQSAEAIDDHTVRLSYIVERHRACPAITRRYVVDADGYRFYLQDVTLTARDIELLREESPGRVNLTLPLPVGARRGSMRYVVQLDYYCNPVQRFLQWPIEVAFAVPFQLPPRVR